MGGEENVGTCVCKHVSGPVSTRGTTLSVVVLTVGEADTPVTPPPNPEGRRTRYPHSGSSTCASDRYSRTRRHWRGRSLTGKDLSRCGKPEGVNKRLRGEVRTSGGRRQRGFL